MTDTEPDETTLAMLAEVIDGRRAVDDPEVAAALAKRPELRRELDEMRGMVAQLDAAGHEARGELRAAVGAELDSADRTAVRALFGRSAPVTRRWWPILLAVAAVVIASWVGWRSFGEAARGRADRDRSLSGTTRGEFSPEGRVESVDEFRWSFVVADGEYHRIEVFDAENPRTAIVIGTPVTDSRWRPSALQLAAIRAARHFRWRVVLEARDGSEVILREIEVWV